MSVVGFENKEFRNLKAWWIISSFEEEYCRCLARPGRKGTDWIELIPQLEDVFSRWTGFIRHLASSPALRHPHLQQVLLQYLQRVIDIHDDCHRWLILYADQRWPADYQIRHPHVRKTEWHSLVRQKAAGFWNEMAARRSNDRRIADLWFYRQDWERWPIGSRERRQAGRILEQRLMSSLRFHLADNRHRLRRLFERTVYAYGGHSTLGKFLDDGIRGYFPVKQVDVEDVHHRAERLILKDFQDWQRNRSLKRWSVLTMTVLFIIAAGIGLNRIERDNHLVQRTVDWFKTVTERFLKFGKTSPQEEFFIQQIIDADVQVSPQKLAAHLHDFESRQEFLLPEGALIFARTIMRDYLLLLATWQISPSLKQEVLEAAGQVSPAVGSALTEVSALFNLKSIRETTIRKKMLDLRRAYVDLGFYPFLFIVLKDYTPYLFVYTERIVGRLDLPTDALDKLGVNLAAYTLEERNPKAYLVTSEEYPFRDKAGYYEGEFAVVFKDIAPSPDWTGWHELGHVVEALRYFKEGIDPPQSVELNAMLFPILFGQDPKKYIEQHLAPLVRSKDTSSYYVQASRAILNGLLLRAAEEKGVQPPELITDDFEALRIDDAVQAALAYPDEKIREPAFLFYYEPQKYLSTAGRGQYRPIESNAQELIYGVHGTIQQGFILSGFGLGRDKVKGPKLIFDGKGEGFGEQNNIGSIISQILAYIFGGQRDFGERNQAVALWAAIITFVLFESSMIGFHLISRSVREQYFSGRRPESIINEIYQNNLWSSGEGYAGESGAKSLCREVIKAHGQIDPLLQRKIKDFQESAVWKERVVFNIALAVASVFPQRSQIRNQAHLLLFYLPFIGPVLARSSWIWPVQKHFHDRERFHHRLVRLVKSIDRHTEVKDIIRNYREFLIEYADKSDQPVPDAGVEVAFAALTETVRLALDREREKIRTAWAGYSSRIRHTAFQNAGTGTDFDRIDKYEPGEDVRDIDWNITARAVDGIPRVRRRSNEDVLSMGLLLDFSRLLKPENHRLWAGDFVRSLKVLGQDRRLEDLIYLFPDGLSVSRRIMLDGQWDDRQVGLELMRMIGREIQRNRQRFASGVPQGVRFYDSKENAVYRQQLALSDTAVVASVSRLKHIRPTTRNLFLVGVPSQERYTLAVLIGKRGRVFFWAGRRAVYLRPAGGHLS